MAKPLQGTIIAYAISDGVGRILLDDSVEELRFSIRSLSGMVPAVGVHVKIGSTEDYPLGGRRALDVSLSDDKAAYEKGRKAFEKAQGEAMRRDLGRRADEFQMPVAAVKKALERELPPPPPVIPAAPPAPTAPVVRGRANTVRRPVAVAAKVAPARAPAPPPAPRVPVASSRAVTAKPPPARPAPAPAPAPARSAPARATPTRNVVKRRAKSND